jgi:hypothetical protein
MTDTSPKAAREWWLCRDIGEGFRAYEAPPQVPWDHVIHVREVLPGRSRDDADAAWNRRALAEAWEVKPLEWVESSIVQIAQTPWGRYSVGQMGEAWFWGWNGQINHGGTEAAAKAAAQADYTTRILSALKVAVEREPDGKD